MQKLNASPARTQNERLESQENFFYTLPLCKLPTLKRIVEDVGFDDIDMLEGMINHSKKAFEEAIDSNLDDKEEGCEHVWTFILRMYRLLKRINYEARLAAGLEDDGAIHILAELNEEGKEECDE